MREASSYARDEEVLHRLQTRMEISTNFILAFLIHHQKLCGDPYEQRKKEREEQRENKERERRRTCEGKERRGTKEGRSLPLVCLYVHPSREQREKRRKGSR